MSLTQQVLIEQLGLEPHIEGGFFKRTFESSVELKTPKGQRLASSSIYYLLSQDSPIGHLHKNTHDILHFYQLGQSIRYTLIDEAGKLSEFILGPNIAQGEQLQLVVPGGVWKASELLVDSRSHDSSYALISEVVSPGFEYEDMQLADKDTMASQYPSLYPKIKHLIKP